MQVHKTMSHKTMSEEELDHIRELIIAHEVVDGPPRLRLLVAQLWPELLHKIKPPRELMH